MKNLLHTAVASADDATLDDAYGVIDAAVHALAALRGTIDLQLLLAAQQLAQCKGRLVVCGVGKSGIAARKIASTCASLGTPSLFLHPTDAAHGDLGKMVEGDMLLCISVSGEASEVIALAKHARQREIFTVAITGNPLSLLALNSEIVLALPQVPEGGALPMVPMASTIATLVLGDALAALVAKMKSFSAQNLASLHPAGRIGKILKPVRTIMHAGNRVPRVALTAGLSDIAKEIGDKGFGITAVVDTESDILLGAISDGDLRRHFSAAENCNAQDLMMAGPQSLHPDDGVDAALEMVRNHRISAIFVVDESTGKLLGIIHVQDLLRLGLI